MQYQEKVRIVRNVTRDKGVHGRIELKNVAEPETVSVFLCGQRLYPIEFNSFGWPIFNAEVCDLFEWKERELKRIHGKDYKLMATVVYNKAGIDISSINSMNGLANTINDLKSLNNVLRDREVYSKILCKGKLDEFVIFGRYILDELGQVWLLDERYEKNVIPMVCNLSDFIKFYTERGEVSWGSNVIIPSEKDSCPCCTKKFTIEDVRTGRFEMLNGKIVHSECKKQYERERMIDEIIYQIMESVYDTGLTFEFLPNGYCSSLSWAHKPWFLCHTPDGDIEIGWRKRVISIEWKDNFKPFDMNIFADEDVTKWDNGIHAWKIEKAREYLKRVKDVVN